MEVLIVALILSGTLGAIGWYFRDEHKKRLAVKSIAERLGLENARLTMKAEIAGAWNKLPAIFTLSTQSSSTHSQLPLVRIRIKTDLPGRFYLRNRACPSLYGAALRPMRHWISPPQVGLANQQDDHMFHLSSKDPEKVNLLLNNPTTRMHLLKNILDADGELILEDGYLHIIRAKRIQLNPSDPVTVEQLEKIFREEWELLRSVIAVLQPMQLHVEDRQALFLDCPFCKSELDEITSVVQCSQCRTLHHETCWTENGRCSIYACNGFPQPVRKQLPAESETVS